jgi:hypothetical protein
MIGPRPRRGREGGHHVVSGKAPGAFYRYGFGANAVFAVGTGNLNTVREGRLFDVQKYRHAPDMVK